MRRYGKFCWCTTCWKLTDNELQCVLCVVCVCVFGENCVCVWGSFVNATLWHRGRKCNSFCNILNILPVQGLVAPTWQAKQCEFYREFYWVLLNSINHSILLSNIHSMYNIVHQSHVSPFWVKGTLSWTCQRMKNSFIKIWLVMLIQEAFLYIHTYFRMFIPCIWFEIRVNYQLDANICLF